MSLTIKISNYTPNLEAIKVYRLKGVFNPNNKPAPIATLPGNATEFTDSDVVRNELNTYVFGAVKNGQETLSKPKVLGYIPYTGPGPQELLIGDHQQGFFGKFAPATMPTPADIAGAFSLPGSISAAPAYWFKFILDGKVLFMPSSSLVHGISGTQIYNAGLMFGVKGNAAELYYTSGGPALVDQYRTFVKGDDEYLVRLPRPAIMKRWTDVNEYASHMKDHEWSRTMDTMFRLTNATLNYDQHRPKYDGLLSTLYSRGAINCLQAACGASSIYHRGQGSSTETTGTAGPTSTSSSSGFLPVLELLY